MALRFTRSGASSDENPIVYHSPVVKNNFLYTGWKSIELFINLYIKRIMYTKNDTV